MRTKKNIIFLYTSLPAYMFKCIEALAKNRNEYITILETSRNKNYPIKFKSDFLDIIESREITFDKIESLFTNCSIVFVSGWANSTIIKLTNLLHRKKIKLCLLNDQPKKDNLRQLIGKYKLENYLKQFDAAIVPGKKAKELLIYYGFEESKIILGLYSSDSVPFNNAKERRERLESYPKNFLFDGQLINRKGIPFLVSEYLNYRNLSKNPWSLIVIGKGELMQSLPVCVDKRGFVDPDDLSSIYANAGCFVLTSLEDHWPLVVHQAVSAGLPILLSKYCFNNLEFFNEQNGYMIDPKRTGSLTEAMIRIENLDEKRLKAMGNYSFQLSMAFSIEKWVENIQKLID